MISAIEIAAARAVPMPWLVGLTVKLKKCGGMYQGLCPFHDDSNPSLAVYHDHAWCFGCMSRGIDKPVDPIAWVQRTKRVDFRTAVLELVGRCETRPIRGVVSHQKAPRSPAEVPSLVLELWRTATAPRLAQFYLESRGVAQKALPLCLRGHQQVWCGQAQEYRPAVLAAVQDPGGRITAIQRVWTETCISFDGQTVLVRGSRCSDLRAGKMCLGPLGSGAVRLAAAGEVLGLAESFEDALAVVSLFRLPCWASLGANRLGNIELPSVTRHVVIFADADESGRAAASTAETAYRRRGYGCQTEFPEVGKDFCEMLRITACSPR